MRGKGVSREAKASKKSDRKPAKGVAREDRGKRLLDLVVLLLGARAPVPFREIKAQFKAYRTQNEEAGLRAFERDKAELLELGVPLRYVTPDEDDSFEEAGYVVDLRRYHLPEIRLTNEEIAALLLASSVARAAPGTPYDEVVDLTLKKLAFDLPRPPDTPGEPRRAPSPLPAARRTEPVLVHFPRPVDEAAIAERLAQLDQATRNRKRVTLSYRSPKTGHTTRRDVDPYGLVYRQGAWLLVGHCHMRKDVRSFRVDRIVDTKVAPKPKTPDFERPAGFDVRRYADRSPWLFEVEPPVTVQLEVLPPSKAIANEDFGPDAKRTQAPGGAWRIEFRCTNPDYLVEKVLAAKGGLVVRAPAEIRKRIRDEIAILEEKYR